MDALAAAPEHHALIMENERVRVLDARILPGQRTRVHTHRWPGISHVLSNSDFIRYNGDGAIVFDSRSVTTPTGENGELPVYWTEPLPPHSLENVGTGEIRVLSIEIKPVKD